MGEVPEPWSVKRLRFGLSLVADRVAAEDAAPLALENLESWTGRLIETETRYEGEASPFELVICCSESFARI